MILRSLLFNACFFGVCVLFAPVVVVFMPLPRGWLIAYLRTWVGVIYALLRLLVGLDYEVRGRHNIPAGGAVFAAKHQSTWDIGIFYFTTPEPAYVLKKELLAIPFFGWALRKSEMIVIDRRAGAAALKGMVRAADRALKSGRAVVIFPEGTRTAPGSRRPYHPGIAALYTQTAGPVVPVAVNSGCFWGRRSFIKYPGRIVIEFLAPMPAGLDRRAFMAELETRIEAASGRLQAEAATRYPHAGAAISRETS